MRHSVPEDLFEKACAHLADIVVTFNDLKGELNPGWLAFKAREALFLLEGAPAHRRLAIRGEFGQQMT